MPATPGPVIGIVLGLQREEGGTVTAAEKTSNISRVYFGEGGGRTEGRTDAGQLGARPAEGELMFHECGGYRRMFKGPSCCL